LFATYRLCYVYVAMLRTGYVYALRFELCLYNDCGHVSDTWQTRHPNLLYIVTARHVTIGYAFDARHVTIGCALLRATSALCLYKATMYIVGMHPLLPIICPSFASALTQRLSISLFLHRTRSSFPQLRSEIGLAAPDLTVSSSYTVEPIPN
jgi:hypothetical protein